MSITIGEAYNTLGKTRCWYAYSGPVQGGGAVPAFVTLINIPNIGLKDTRIKILPYYGSPIALGTGDALGIEVTVDGLVVIRNQGAAHQHDFISSFELLVPKQSSLQIQSRNTGPNNAQDRGVNVVGWYL